MYVCQKYGSDVSKVGKRQNFKRSRRLPINGRLLDWLSSQSCHVLCHTGWLKARYFKRGRSVLFLTCDTHGSCVSYRVSVSDICVKLGKFHTNCRRINCIFRNKVCWDTKLKLHKVMAVPVLSYECELWIATKKEDSKIRTSTMEFLRLVQSLSLIHI